MTVNKHGLDGYGAYLKSTVAEPDALGLLAGKFRDKTAPDGYDNKKFREDATEAVVESTDLTREQATVVVSGAMERRQDWTDAHDYGNLLEEIQWYVILYDSIKRNGGKTND